MTASKRPPSDGRTRHVPAPSPPALDVLLGAAASYDKAAFASLYDETAARIFGQVLSVVGSRHLAEEVTHDAYLQVWRTADCFAPGRGNALSWLLALSHRTAVDRVRLAGVSGDADAVGNQDHAELATGRAAPWTVMPLEASLTRRAFECLSPVQRQALELAYFGGHTLTEVAQLTGETVETTVTAIRGALLELRGVAMETS